MLWDHDLPISPLPYICLCPLATDNLFTFLLLKHRWWQLWTYPTNVITRSRCWTSDTSSGRRRSNTSTLKRTCSTSSTIQELSSSTRPSRTAPAYVSYTSACFFCSWSLLSISVTRIKGNQHTGTNYWIIAHSSQNDAHKHIINTENAQDRTRTHPNANGARKKNRERRGANGLKMHTDRQIGHGERCFMTRGTSFGHASLLGEGVYKTSSIFDSFPTEIKENEEHDEAG